MKEKLLLDWKNHYLGQSYQQAFAQFDTLMIDIAQEKKKLRPLLEAYTYEKFKEQIQSWMIGGRFLWYICGNYDQDKAIELVEKTRQKFNVKPLEHASLTRVKPIAIQDGKCYVIEQGLEDKTNENSCVVTYFESGPEGSDLKLKLINKVVMQYLNEPFFSDLRTKQQLGYVVFSRPLCVRDISGCQFLVQSPSKSCEYAVKAISQFLVDQRELVKKMTEEEFKVQQGAVH